MLRNLGKPAFLFACLTVACISSQACADDLLVGEYLNLRAYRYASDGTNLGVFCSLPANNGLRFEGMAFDANGDLYIANGANPGIVHRFSASGQDLGIFASSGLFDAVDVAFDKAGDLYVTSYQNNEVRRYSATGQDLGAFASVNTASGLAFDTAGNLYVSSYSVDTVHRFSPNGADLGTFAASLNHPYGMAFDAAGNLYVADRGSNSILRFSSAGAPLGTWTSPSLNDPLNVKFDSAGDLFVTNYGGGTISRFSATGQDLGVFASGLSNPDGLAFAPGNGVPEASSFVSLSVLWMLGCGTGLLARRRNRR